MARTIVVEEFWEFADRHGGRNAGYAIRDDKLLREFPAARQMILYRDGAMVREDDGNMRFEPHTDPLRNLAARRCYAAEHLKRISDEFRQIYMAAMAWPQEGSKAHITAAKAKKDEAEATFEKLDKELQALISNTPQARAKRDLEESQTRIKAEQDKLRDEIRQIANAS